MSELRLRLEEALNGCSFLRAPVVQQLCANFDLSSEDLLPDLLRIAQSRAVVPTSEFRVGAVLGAENQAGETEFFLGANFETAGGSLQQTVHAEQAAIHNALVHGAGRASSLAVTAMPCGHCRQFMRELHGAVNLSILVCPPNDEQQARKFTLSELLPSPFGPSDLGLPATLLARATEPLCCTQSFEWAELAEHAARRSYTPYSGSPSARCVELENGRSLTACAIESAAFNPSLPPQLAMQSLLALHGFASVAIANSRGISR